MTNEISNDLVNKIRKLLALSENNDSQAQAEAALQKAKELAIRHDIDIASIQVFESKKESEPIVKSEGINLGKRKSVCQHFVSWILQNHFKVKIIYSGGRYFGQTFTIIGKTSDIQIATYIQGFLNSEMMKLWHDYKDKNNAPCAHRNSWLWGFYNGLTKKLENQEKESENNCFQEMELCKGKETVEQTKSCYALAKIDHKEQLEKKMEEFYPHLRKASRSSTSHHHSGEARQAGFSAGQNVNLRPAISSGNQGQIRY